MTSARNIADLFFQLRGTGSPVGKMRILLQAWGVLRGLTPSQRADVARELGFEGAEELVTRAAVDRGQLPPAVLMAALEKAGAADPADLNRLLQELRHPGEGKGLVQRGLAALESLLVNGSLEGGTESTVDGAREDAGRAPEEFGEASVRESGEEPTEGGPAEPSSPDPDEPGLADAAMDDEVPPRSTPPPPPPPVSKPKAPVVLAALPPPVDEVASPGDRDDADRRPGSEADGSRVVSQDERPVLEPWRPPPTRAAPKRTDVTRRAPDSGSELLRNLAEERTTMGRLRIFRDHLPILRELGVEVLVDVLRTFDRDWARRRALMAMLETGTPEGIDDVLELVDVLETRAARRWCLATLLSLRGLNEDERREVARREELGWLRHRYLA